MLLVIWDYEVRPCMEAAFERLYGADGDWAALFREYEGFIATELVRGEGTGRYLSIDRWQSEALYDAFLAGARERYAHIDALGDALTLDEHPLGRFTTTC